MGGIIIVEYIELVIFVDCIFNMDSDFGRRYFCYFDCYKIY